MWTRAWIAAPCAGALLVVAAAAIFAGVVGYGATPDAAAGAAGAEVEIAAPAGEAGESRLVAVSRQMRAKVGWAVAGVSLLLALGVALTLPWWIVHGALATLGPRRRRLMLGAAAAAAGAGIAVFFAESKVLPHFVQILVDDLPPAVVEMRRWLKGLSAAAIVTMVFAFGAPLAVARGDRTLVHLAGQTRRLRTLLFVGTALLVAGLLEIAALLRWPAVQLAKPEGEAVRQAADALAVAAGTLLTVLLLATYGVAALILRARIASLAREEALDAKAVTAELEEQGAGVGLFQQVARLVALLAPLLAGGPVTTILDMLTY
ncbi:MAG: hypothetical protein R3325_10325 [Thermoanaerobaculia bacterium]|nr:hypothetical protein [Thermoanaerobaculia bacterium]